jgi:hypothetical protein
MVKLRISRSRVSLITMGDNKYLTVVNADKSEIRTWSIPPSVQGIFDNAKPVIEEDEGIPGLYDAVWILWYKMVKDGVSNATSMFDGLDDPVVGFKAFVLAAVSVEQPAFPNAGHFVYRI